MLDRLSVQSACCLRSRLLAKGRGLLSQGLHGQIVRRLASQHRHEMIDVLKDRVAQCVPDLQVVPFISGGVKSGPPAPGTVMVNHVPVYTADDEMVIHVVAALEWRDVAALSHEFVGDLLTDV